ncbi:MAG: peroxidase [Planctomycetes bacterium]|nr:peroxidase [Planctomycetota bacterium]
MAADELVEQLARDWQKAPLSASDRALCEFAERLTATPAAMGVQEVSRLREHGFADAAVHDAAQVVSYFNYINRVADALGVELETFVRAWGEDAG